MKKLFTALVGLVLFYGGSLLILFLFNRFCHVYFPGRTILFIPACMTVAAAVLLIIVAASGQKKKAASPGKTPAQKTAQQVQHTATAGAEKEEH
jgi:hypothetical protein